MNRKEENAAVHAMRAGFTLIEILVAVAIIGILGTIAVVNIPKKPESSNRTAAKSGVDALKSGCVTYKMKKGSFPSDLKKLVEGEDPYMEGGEEALVDPWGSEYKYEKKGNKNIVIISAGGDQEFGTDDDIRSDKALKKDEDKD